MGCGTSSVGASAGQYDGPDPPNPTGQTSHRMDQPNRRTLSQLSAKKLYEFEQICSIGSGGFGSVYAVKWLRNNIVYAMKVIDKSTLSPKRVRRLVLERELQATSRSTSVVNLHFAFQDRENAYLVMDLCTGGDLFWLAHGQAFGRLPEYAAKFYAAQAVLALADLHARGIIHRDVKPENLMIDSDGFVRIGDFGVFVRTRKHDRMADMYALGVTVHQLLFGTRPYPADRESIQTMVRMRSFIPAKAVLERSVAQRVLVKAQRKRWRSIGVVFGCTLDDSEEQAQIAAEVMAASRGGLKGTRSMHEAEFKKSKKKSSIGTMQGLLSPGAGEVPIPPPKPSKEGLDFVERLLICNEHWRLGGDGIQEVMEHPWFEEIDWQALRARLLTPPWVPASSERLSLAGLQSRLAPQLPHQAAGGIRKTKSQQAMPSDRMRRRSFATMRAPLSAAKARKGEGLWLGRRQSGAGSPVGRGPPRGLLNRSRAASVDEKSTHPSSAASLTPADLGGREITAEAAAIRKDGVIGRAQKRAGARTLSHMLQLARVAQKSIERNPSKAKVVVGAGSAAGRTSSNSSRGSRGEAAVGHARFLRAKGSTVPGSSSGSGTTQASEAETTSDRNIMEGPRKRESSRKTNADVESSMRAAAQSASIEIFHSGNGSDRGNGAHSRVADGDWINSADGEKTANAQQAIAYIEGFDYRVMDERAAEEVPSLRVPLPAPRTRPTGRAHPLTDRNKKQKTGSAHSGGSKLPVQVEAAGLVPLPKPSGSSDAGEAVPAPNGAPTDIVIDKGANGLRRLTMQETRVSKPAGSTQHPRPIPNGDVPEGPTRSSESEGIIGQGEEPGDGGESLGTIAEAASDAETSMHSGMSGSRGGSLASMHISSQFRKLPKWGLTQRGTQSDSRSRSEKGKRSGSSREGSSFAVSPAYCSQSAWASGHSQLEADHGNQVPGPAHPTEAQRSGGIDVTARLDAHAEEAPRRRRGEAAGGSPGNPGHELGGLIGAPVTAASRGTSMTGASMMSRSVESSFRGSIDGSMHGSVQGSMEGSVQGGSVRGSIPESRSAGGSSGSPPIEGKPAEKKRKLRNARAYGQPQGPHHLAPAEGGQSPVAAIPAGGSGEGTVDGSGSRASVLAAKEPALVYARDAISLPEGS